MSLSLVVHVLPALTPPLVKASPPLPPTDTHPRPFPPSPEASHCRFSDRRVDQAERVSQRVLVEEDTNGFPMPCPDGRVILLDFSLDHLNLFLGQEGSQMLHCVGFRKVSPTSMYGTRGVERGSCG